MFASQGVSILMYNLVFNAKDLDRLNEANKMITGHMLNIWIRYLFVCFPCVNNSPLNDTMMPCRHLHTNLSGSQKGRYLFMSVDVFSVGLGSWLMFGT